MRPTRDLKDYLGSNRGFTIERKADRDAKAAAQPKPIVPPSDETPPRR